MAIPANRIRPRIRCVSWSESLKVKVCTISPYAPYPECRCRARIIAAGFMHVTVSIMNLASAAGSGSLLPPIKIREICV